MKGKAPRPRHSLRGAAIGAVLAVLAVLAVILAPLLTPHAPDVIDLQVQLSPPSPMHPLGTDFYGRDVAARLLYGGRATLAASAGAVAIAVLAGVVLGLAAGVSQGWRGQLWAGLFDVLLAFPALLLALLVVAVLGAGLPALAVAVGVASIPAYARLVRTLTLELRATPYVDAARALGGAQLHVLVRHILPGVRRAVVALATLDLGRTIVSVAALGFLGLGAPPPQAEWGVMLYEGRNYLASAPWASAAPGLAITLTVLGVTLLGDALSDTGPV
jgi:peptide/nickel transport system permease protein